MVAISAPSVSFQPDLPRSADVVVIGAGVVGVSTAFALAAAGRSVLVIDRKGVGEETSFGNAGAFAFSDIIPLATKGMLGKVPKWLADPLGPLTVPPRYGLQIAPWLVRFWRAGWPDRVAASIKAQSDLMRVSQSSTDWILAEAGIADAVRTIGSLELYESEAEFEASLAGWKTRAEQGIAFHHVRGAALVEQQPGLSDRFVAGTVVPQWRMVNDPHYYVRALAVAAQSRGVAFIKGEIGQVQAREDGVDITLADGRSLTARQVAVCAGAWSKTLAAQLGDRIPLETERGYNTTLPTGAFDLKRQLIFGGHGFVVSPLASGIRVGGAVELGGLKLKPNFARADAMLKKAKDFLPGLDPQGGTQWMGFRPSLPDSLPAIGMSSKSPNVVYAFGHGHLGLTQSAGTARLVSQLLNHETPAIALAPFRPQRFAFSRI